PAFVVNLLQTLLLQVLEALLRCVHHFTNPGPRGIAEPAHEVLARIERIPRVFLALRHGSSSRSIRVLNWRRHYSSLERAPPGSGGGGAEGGAGDAPRSSGHARIRPPKTPAIDPAECFPDAPPAKRIGSPSRVIRKALFVLVLALVMLLLGA